MEVKALQFARDGNVAKFLYEEIFTRYGVPREIVTNQGPQFTSDIITKIGWRIWNKPQKFHTLSPLGQWPSGGYKQGNRENSDQDNAVTQKILGC